MVVSLIHRLLLKSAKGLLMLKTILLSMILMTGLIADTATKPFPKKTEQATNSEPPKVVDKTWIFCAKSENRFYYFDAATVKFDADLQASLVWVKQFDIPGERIRVMRYAYRNDGSEFPLLVWQNMIRI